jgi:hypothetical protein
VEKAPNQIAFVLVDAINIFRRIRRSFRVVSRRFAYSNSAVPAGHTSFRGGFDSRQLH